MTLSTKLNLRVDLLLRKQLELFIRDQSTPKFEVTVHAAGIVCPENCLDSGEEPWRAPYKVGEDELKL